jgi:uncharacterized protein (DUF2235 family)
MKTKEKENEVSYTKGLSEDIRRICRSYGVKVAFESAIGPTMREIDWLRSKIEKQSSVV